MAAATASMVAVGGLLSLEQPAAASRRVASKASTSFLGNVSGLRATHIAPARTASARAVSVRAEKVSLSPSPRVHAPAGTVHCAWALVLGHLDWVAS